jgi:hypothetical protein
MAQGADSVIAHGKGTVWNTAVNVNVPLAGLLLNNWPIGNGLGPLVYSESLTGSGGRSNAIRGLTKLTGDITTELRYSGLEHLFAQIMGIAGVPVMSDTTAQTHTFQLNPDVTGIFDTVAVMKVGPLSGPLLPIWEYPSVKFGGFVITFTADGLATMTVPVIASSCKPLTGQVNNTLAAVTYRNKFLNVFGTHLQFLANTASGPALVAPTDQFYPSQIVLTFTRNLDSAYVMDGSGVQPEPYYTTFFDVTLSVTFPVYGPGFLQANNTFLQNAFGEVPMKMIIRATSPQLAGTTLSPPASTVPYSWLFEFPNVVIGDTQMPINDAGVIPQTVEMAALDTPTAPLGMTGLTKHMRLTNVSRMATNAALNP